MEGNGSPCILELKFLECMAPMMTMKGKESAWISHPTLELHFNLEIRRITSAIPSLLSDLVKMAPHNLPRAQEIHIKRDMGK